MVGSTRPVARRAVGATGLATFMLLGACSGGSSNEPAPTSVSPQPSTTAASTTAAPTTESPPTIAPTSAVVPTTVPETTTTVDSAAAADADVRGAVDLVITTFSDCLVAMPTCDTSSLAAARAGELLATNTARISEWNSKGYTARNRESFRYVIESIVLSDDLRRATVVVCFSDDSDLVLPGGAPDGSDVVIDDTYGSGRESWDLRLDSDGVWRAYAAPALGPIETVDVCPAA